MLVSTTNWCLPSASAEIEPCVTAAADLQGGEWGTLCSRKSGGKVFRWLGIFKN